MRKFLQLDLSLKTNYLIIIWNVSHKIHYATPCQFKIKILVKLLVFEAKKPQNAPEFIFYSLVGICIPRCQYLVVFNCNVIGIERLLQTTLPCLLTVYNSLGLCLIIDMVAPDNIY